MAGTEKEVVNLLKYLLFKEERKKKEHSVCRMYEDCTKIT